MGVILLDLGFSKNNNIKEIKWNYMKIRNNINLKRFFN